MNLKEIEERIARAKKEFGESYKPDPEKAWLITEVKRLFSYVDCNGKDAEIRDLEEKNHRLSKRVKEVYKNGWDNALECMEAEKGINGYPTEAQFENCWYAYECEIQALQHKEGE